MTTKDIQKLLDIVNKAVNGTDGNTWQARRDAILAEAGDDDKTALAEFANWFYASDDDR